MGESNTFFDSYISEINRSEIYFKDNKSLYSLQMASEDVLAISEIKDSTLIVFVFWTSNKSPSQILSDAVNEIQNNFQENNLYHEIEIEYGERTRLTLIETSFTNKKNTIEDTQHSFVVLLKPPEEPCYLKRASFRVGLSVIILALIGTLVFNSSWENFFYFTGGILVPIVIDYFSWVNNKKLCTLDITPFNSSQSAASVVTPDQSKSDDLVDP